MRNFVENKIIFLNKKHTCTLGDRKIELKIKFLQGPDYTETAYIATQGPLPHTCTDFWEMVWHTQVSNWLVLIINDSNGLFGKEIRFFIFNNWSSRACFANTKFNCHSFVCHFVNNEISILVIRGCFVNIIFFLEKIFKM